MLDFARDFFARLIQKLLEYYISRDIPNYIGPNKSLRTIDRQIEFRGALERHCREAALIVEAFAGGWYSKINYQGTLNPSTAQGFSDYARRSWPTSCASAERPMADNLFLCGLGPTQRAAYKGGRELHLHGPKKNLRLQMDDIRRQLIEVETYLLTDLVEIATYVFAADNLVSRGGDAGSATGRTRARR